MNRILILVLLTLTACGTPPKPPPDGGSPDAGAGKATDCMPPPSAVENVAACVPPTTDYQPRVSGSANDPWPACVSDDNAYHPINPNISSIARVTGFQQVAVLLWRDAKIPSAQDFIDARVVYAQAEGLDSRVQRREDVHYPAPQASDGGTAPKCADLGVPQQYPERCVGPAKLLPILNDAFARGASGEAPRLHAAHIEAALLWFLYASSLSEATSCATKPQDCDSAWAYYAGGALRDAPLGLGGYLKALAPETHQQAYDGTLAVRCWKNLDNETGISTDSSTQLRARDQLDRALVRGVAMIARQRALELGCADVEGKTARLGFLGVLAPLLDREARARSASLADSLKQEAGRPADQVSSTALVKALDDLFPCP